jgi:hypothetical protein
VRGPKVFVPDEPHAITKEAGALGATKIESASAALTTDVRPVEGSGNPATESAPRASEVSRIEIQTADPSIRIIWLAPQKSEGPDPNEPKNENGEKE